MEKQQKTSQQCMAKAADTVDPSPADAEEQQTTALVEAEEQAAAEHISATSEPAAEPPEGLAASGEQWLQQQLACEKQEQLLLETEAKRQ